MSRWRVVYADHVALPSGGEIALARLLPALLDWVDPLVVLGEDGPLVEMLRSDGIEVRVEPLVDRARTVHRDDLSGMVRGSFASVGYARRLAKILREERADLLHTNSLKAHLYGGAAGRLAGVPVVWHLRDRIADDYLPRPQVWMVRAAAFVLPRVVIANSEATASTIRGYVRGSTMLSTMIDVIPSPVIQTAIPIQVDHEFVFTCLARISPWKGQDVFLRAFAQAFRGTATRAVIAGAPLFGEQDYADELPRLAKELGIADQVDFAGHVADIGPLLAGTSVLVHCSLIPEPFGQVVVEGMAAGIPVIAARAGGPTEIITDGVNGLLYEPGDVAALAAAMGCLHDDPVRCKELARNGRVAAVAYRPERIAEQVRRVYERAAPARSVT